MSSVNEYALRTALKDEEFNNRFSKVVRSIAILEVYGVKSISRMSAEEKVIRAESERNTKNWAARELIRLNRQNHFVKGYVDLKNESAVDTLLWDVYDASINLVDVLNL